MTWVNPLEYLSAFTSNDPTLTDAQYISFGIELCLLIVISGIILSFFVEDSTPIITGAVVIGGTGIMLWPLYITIAGVVIGVAILAGIGFGINTLLITMVEGIKRRVR